MNINYKENQYGFEFGAAKVERCCSDPKKGWVILRVQTPKNTLELYVTKCGKVRVFDPKGEWIAARKEVQP